MPDIVFREAVPSDAQCIGVLGAQVYLDTYASNGIRPSIAEEVLSTLSTDAVATMLARPRARCIVAERANHLVGFALLSIGASHALVPAAHPVELERLYVLAPFTGRGLGTALLARAEAVVVDVSATALWLTAWVFNTRALAFYARRGYDDAGATIHAIGDERHENRLFVKALGTR